MASIEMNLNAWPVKDVLPTLLIDRTTKKNIIFATDSYAEQGQEYGAKNQITEEALKVLDIQPRVLKNAEEQVLRTRKKAEVFTPSWVCCLMNNHADDVWFKRSDVFGQLTDTVWMPIKEAVQMPKRRRWQTYVDARRLEITCGEAPYLVSRYDMGTGEIIPIENRVGMLDRKLRIVNENAESEAEWLKWAIRALQAVYGYEYQGDNLLIARVNLLMTFVEYLQERWQRDATLKELQEAAKVISWNIWQMDGLKGTIPMGALYEQYHQMSLFEMFVAEMGIQNEVAESIPSRIYDWRGQNKSVEYNAFREGRNGGMKFDFIIGNPPYQEQTDSKSSRMLPLYDKFMEEAYKCGKKVELITPARFLFNAGFTSKEWNNLRLNDEHFKVLFYEADSSKVFSNVDLKGGVAVTYRDESQSFGAIGMFIPSVELNSIADKVVKHNSAFVGLNTIICPRDLLHYSEMFFIDYPEFREMNNNNNVVNTNAFEKFPVVFLVEPFENSIPVVGRSKKGRETRYIKSDYLDTNDFIDVYKLIIPEVNGSGKFGETMASSLFGDKGTAFTDTFICIGRYTSEFEVNATAKYIQTKFVRAMLGILKKTQHNTADKWKYVPLQDFTANSDINWSVPIKAIDQQLYKKYGLSDEEITFIETHVKEMS